jgi:hypothetical protein
MKMEALVNDFAVRSFRDVADGDYIAARMACRVGLVIQFLWSSQQAMEKYLKCVLLLNRIPAKDVGHDLGKALSRISASGKLTIELTPPTGEFIQKLDQCGACRYLEVSHFALGSDLVVLDRAAWELRRYCILGDVGQRARLQEGIVPPKVRIPGGYLEKIVDDENNLAREALLWQNGFFGKRPRKKVRLDGWLQFHSAPLSLNPEMLDEVLKYVHLPKELIKGYRGYAKT